MVPTHLFHVSFGSDCLMLVNMQHVDLYKHGGTFQSHSIAHSFTHGQMLAERGWKEKNEEEYMECDGERERERARKKLNE